MVLKTPSHHPNANQDANHVEAALLLDGKKFPPMLPRDLRVTRAKDPRRTALALEKSRAKTTANGKSATTKHKSKPTPEQLSLAGRAGKLLGRSGAAKQKREGRAPRKATAKTSELKSPEEIVFEGRRASANDANIFSKKSKNGRAAPKRGARRAQEWRKKTGAK